MSYEELNDKYVKIGRNRRLDQANGDSVMGRKGIGKLAALYLSRHYYILTKKLQNHMYIYEMNFKREKEESNNENPKMDLIPELNVSNKEFMQYEKGTMVRMEEVDLKGYATTSFESLEKMLSDFFYLSNLHAQNIYIKLITDEKDLKTSKFVPIKKMTPFKNMVQIICFDSETYQRIFAKLKDNKYKIPYRKRKEQFYVGDTDVKLAKIKVNESGYKIPETETKKWGDVKGWIGIHSSIDTLTAQKNDTNYKKNKLYSSLKLRVYVRNKLAIDNFLNMVNNTQTFFNYIEGEISYDILDDNQFPDIATTNRQGMDENDGRIIDLATAMKKQVQQLIRARQTISEKMKSEEKALDDRSDNKAKSQLSAELDTILDKVPAITTLEKNNVKTGVLQRIKGKMIKNNYLIFFSHSRNNKDIVDFFYYFLKSLGVTENEMFYTSKDDHPEVQLREDLEKISKKNITDANTVIFFYFSKDFKDSEYCMFEGGAAWATRTKEDYFLSFDNYENVPAYLKPGNEFLLNVDKNLNILQGDIYNKIIFTLNFFIKHINSGRQINEKPLISLLQEVNFPDRSQLRIGEHPNLNEKLIFYWDTYIKSGVYEEAKEKEFISSTINVS